MSGVRARRSRQPDGVLLRPAGENELDFAANDQRHHAVQIDPGASSGSTDMPVFMEDQIAGDVAAI